VEIPATGRLRVPGFWSDIMTTVPEGKNVRIETSLGTFTLRLYADMPITAGNFAALVQKGFYDKTIFHRVIPRFMVQGGDPTGTGTGGPGYTIKDELNASHRNRRGTIAMANTGRPNTGGSQFFISVVDNPHLDGKHPVFGEVIEGMDVVDKISRVKTGRNDRPVPDVTIIKAAMA
jgi:peptidylprolyl isomerase